MSHLHRIQPNAQEVSEYFEAEDFQPNARDPKKQQRQEAQIGAFSNHECSFLMDHFFKYGKYHHPKGTTIILNDGWLPGYIYKCMTNDDAWESLHPYV